MTQVTWVQHGTGVRSLGSIDGYMMNTDILIKYISYTFQLLTNGEEIRVRSYIPGSATDQTPFGAKIDHGLSQ